MYEFLSYDGFLIQKIFPGISLEQIIFLHRMSKLIQLSSAMIIIVDLAGPRKCNKVIHLLGAPLAKLLNKLLRLVQRVFRIPSRDLTPESFYSYYGTAVIIFYALLWIAAPNALGHWFHLPYTLFEEVLDSAFLGISILKGLMFLVILFFWFMFGFAMAALGIMVLIVMMVEGLSRTEFSEIFFRLVFLSIFVLGFVLDFFTGR